MSKSKRPNPEVESPTPDFNEDAGNASSLTQTDVSRPPTAVATKISWRDVLRIHPAAELFPTMGADELAELGKDIVANGLQQPIVTYRGGDNDEVMLLDGRNRLDALEAAGIELVKNGGFLVSEPGGCDRSSKAPSQPYLIRHVTGIDPYAFVLSANVHRRHLTAEQKRSLIENLVKAMPEKSNRYIAEQVKRSHHTVEAVRTRLEATGQIAQLDKTVGKDGKPRAAKKLAPPKRSKPTAKRSARAAIAAEPAPPPEDLSQQQVVVAIAKLLKPFSVALRRAIFDKAVETLEEPALTLGSTVH